MTSLAGSEPPKDLASDRAPDPWKPGLTNKQRQIIVELREFALCFYWAEAEGLHHVLKSLSYAIKVRVNEFLAIGETKRIQDER